MMRRWRRSGRINRGIKKAADALDLAEFIGLVIRPLVFVVRLLSRILDGV